MNPGEFQLVEQALENAAELYRFTFPDSESPTQEILQRSMVVHTYQLLKSKIEADSERNFKYSLSLFLEFYLAVDRETVTDPPVIFHSEPFLLSATTPAEELLTQLEQVYNNFVLQVEIFSANGSGYVLARFNKLELSTIQFDPIRAGSHIELPKPLRQAKRGLLNIENKDSRCLLYCLVAWDLMKRDQLPAGNRSRPAHYEGSELAARWDMRGTTPSHLTRYILYPLIYLLINNYMFIVIDSENT